MSKGTIIFLVLAISLYPCFAFGATINVPADQPTIQAGLASASFGDIVVVADGTYNENIVWPDADGISLRSEHGPSSCTIDGGGAGSVISMTKESLTKMTVLEGFTIRNGSGTSFQYDDGTSAFCGGGILVHNCSPTIRNLFVWDNSAAGLGGGIFLGFSSAMVKNCVIAGWGTGYLYSNSADKGGGVYLYYSSPAMLNNTIAYNRATTSGGGIYSNNSGASIVNSIIWGNDPGSVSLEPSTGKAIRSTLSITYCDVDGGWTGVGNLAIDPGLREPEGGDFILDERSPCIDVGDAYTQMDKEDPLNPGYALYPSHGFKAPDMGKYGGDGDWPSGVIGGVMTGTIEAKKTAYVVSEDILVPGGAKGVLTIEPGVELMFHNRSGLMVYGMLKAEGTEESEILFTRWEEWDKGAGVRFYEGSSGSMSFCWVESMENTSGAGIYCYSASLELANCTVTGNSAEENGGGIYC